MRKGSTGQRIPIAERFWAKVHKTDACWEWTGATRNGYGHFTIGVGQQGYAHRISWELANGPIPPGLEVCHACDNPPCVRPDHLFVGTRADNARDMGLKHRSSFTTHPEIVLRGEGWHAVHRKRATCLHGHDNTPENRTRWGQCAPCARVRSRDYQRRRRAKV